MTIRSRRAVLCACVSIALVGALRADVAVTGLFSDHMVVQRDVPLTVWGTARPGEAIRVTLGHRNAATQADTAGRWRVRLEPLAAGGPIDLTIAGDNTLAIRDVLVGEVWLCSGQSNMAFPVQRALNPEQEIAAATHPRLRLLKVRRQVADEPQDRFAGQWQVCSPETVGEFSAVGYFFGRDLHKALDVPVGLIDSAVGGTPAEAWTPRPVLEADPDFKPILDRWERQFAAARAAEKKTSASRPNRNASRAATKPAPRLADLRQSPQQPAVLYNAMIHPLVPFALRGAVWYQGEGNAKYAYQYRTLFPAMIRSWRQAWGQGDFPFLFVQLTNWQHSQTEPYRSAWAELREAQLMTLSLPATAMAVTTDIGDPKDIHPRNKQEVGRRLALAARAIVFGHKIPYSGPLYQSMSVEGSAIRVRFTHTDGGLAARGGGPLKGFAVAGSDQKFVEAQAAIDGNTVLVRSDRVPDPVAVRYAWADVPDDNLVNGTGLPASPFRTDDWPGLTRNER